MTVECLEIAGLTLEQFRAISKLVKERCGINLHDGKMALVAARLQRRIRELKLSGIGEYLEYVRNDVDGNEVTVMLEALTTNVTHFFREAHHFDYLRSTLLPTIEKRNRATRRIRIWSAGCSSGEEPYSVAIILWNALEQLPGWDARILATDLSRDVLLHAREALYKPNQLEKIPPTLMRQAFTVRRSGSQLRFQVKPPIRSLVDFTRLNLMDHWPMQGPFDAIFCRNVMIYFDKPTQEQLVTRFWNLLAPEGTLFIGHSESLAGIRHLFSYQQPAVYQKRDAPEDE